VPHSFATPAHALSERSAKAAVPYVDANSLARLTACGDQCLLPAPRTALEAMTHTLPAHVPHCLRTVIALSCLFTPVCCASLHCSPTAHIFAASCGGMDSGHQVQHAGFSPHVLVYILPLCTSSAGATHLLRRFFS